MPLSNQISSTSLPRSYSIDASRPLYNDTHINSILNDIDNIDCTQQGNIYSIIS